MTTFTDGAPPSVTPEPDDGSVPHRADAPDADADAGQDPDSDAGSAWLRDEIQRRIADRAASGGGRHARRGEPTSSSEIGYVPRHSVATPGPGAPRPGPVGGQMSQASELLRRERTEGGTQPVWSGPPSRPAAPHPAAPPPAAPQPAAAQPAPAPSDGDGAPGPVRPGVAAAAAMRGAARGRARAAAAATTTAPPAAPPVEGAPTSPPRPSNAPSGAPQDLSATAPVKTASPASTTSLPASTPPPGTVPDDAAAIAAPTGPVPAVAPAAPPTQDDAAASARAEPVAAPTTPVRPVLPAFIPARHLPPPSPELPEASEDAAEQVDPSAGIKVPEQRGAEQRGAELRGVPLARPGVPEDQSGKRVRVVLAERKGVARPVRTVITIQESTGVGELLRTNLIGSQLAIALRFAIGAGLTLGLLPLLFAMVPDIGRIEVLGLRLPWLLLGVLVYPFLFGLGLWHTRTAEHLEQNFAETVQD